MKSAVAVFFNIIRPKRGRWDDLRSTRVILISITTIAGIWVLPAVISQVLITGLFGLLIEGHTKSVLVEIKEERKRIEDEKLEFIRQIHES